MKRHFLLSLLFIATIGMYSCSDTALDDVNSHVSGIQNQPTEHQMNEEDADADPQWQAMQQYDRFMSNFQSVPIGPGDVDLPFPGYYGGAYINDDNKLVVQVKGNSEKLKRKIYDLVGSEDIIIQRANHSMGTLNRIMNSLNEFKLNPAYKAASANWNAYGLMESNNEIVIELDDFSDDRIREFRKTVMNHPSIRFTKSKGRVVTEANLDAGCKTSVRSDMSGYKSIAFRAKRNSDGAEGVVSVGHGFEKGEPAYYDGFYIGNCTFSQEGGSVDVAFIDVFYPDYDIPTNKICNTTNYISTITSLPGTGTVVNKRGASTGATSGKIICTNKTITTNRGVTLTNVTQADYYSTNGDSGGIVYTYVSSTNTRYTVGVHLGTAPDGNRYFTKADEALSAIGATRY